MEESIRLFDCNKIAGIYHILNIDNGFFYVGSSINMKSRGLSHLRALRKGNHHNQFLQRAWNKYGESRFVFIPLVQCSKDSLIEEENKYIKIWRDGGRCYNIADASKVFDWTGRRHSKETLVKMSKSAYLTRKRKLTESQVLEIRDSIDAGAGYPALAKKYNVCTSTIYKIAHRKKWNHI